MKTYSVNESVFDKLDQSQQERLDFYLWAAQMDREYAADYQPRRFNSNYQSKVINKNLTTKKSVVK